MSKRRTVDIIEELVNPIVHQLELELVDVEFVKEGQERFLRIYIDKEGGVTLDDCQGVSEQLSNILDELDPIEDSYYLEVSSPGIDRTLKKEKDFEKFMGSEIEVYLYQAIDGKKMLEGQLLGLQEDTVLLGIVNGDCLKISREKIAKVKLAVKI